MKKIFVILFIVFVLSASIVAAEHDDDYESDHDDHDDDYSSSRSYGDNDPGSDYEYDNHEDDYDDDSWDVSDDFVVVEEPIVYVPEPVFVNSSLELLVFETMATNYSDIINSSNSSNLSEFNDLYLTLASHLANDTGLIPSIEDYVLYLKQKDAYVQTMDELNSSNLTNNVKLVNYSNDIAENNAGNNSDSFFVRLWDFFGLGGN